MTNCVHRDGLGRCEWLVWPGGPCTRELFCRGYAAKPEPQKRAAGPAETLRVLRGHVHPDMQPASTMR